MHHAPIDGLFHAGFERGGRPIQSRWRNHLVVILGVSLAACSPGQVEGRNEPDAGQRDASARLDGGAAPNVPDAGASNQRDAMEDGGVPDADPPLPQFGLQRRPTNATCVPPADPNAPAQRLSATGCVDATDPRRPAAGLIPYDVASPLWSDGAAKERFIALPEGGVIHVKDCRERPQDCAPLAEGGTPESDGKLEVPVGTVLVKTFSFGGKPLETRLFIRFDDHWGGYSYQWRDDGSDADLVEDVFGGKQLAIRDEQGRQQVWTFPSREMCGQCHTSAAGGSLGIELRQLNIDYTYPSGVRSNQLETLEHIGVFAKSLIRPLPASYPFPEGTSGTLERRARSYLHANCANCHRPQGNFDAFDLRFDTPLGMTAMCNEAPTRGSLGVEGAVRLAPGAPALSLLSLRMRATDDNRMPRIATSLVHEAGAALVEEWIRSLRQCE